MRKGLRAMALIGAGLAPVCGIAALRQAIAAPLLLYNPSPSEPLGLYRLVAEEPAPGRIIAFHVPSAGHDYARAHMPYVTRNSILKEIVAGSGSLVCERQGDLVIDGRQRGAVAARDRKGVALPHWSGCRRLQVGEYFALSNRIPNSFDSRYYGPVTTQNILGVYVPLWTE